MTAADRERSTPSPDEAFATLGNETRLNILQALGAADGPLAFSALFDRVDVDDSGRFNYHLGELVGHFVGKTDAGYELRQAGRRVVEAVLSGAVTDAPVVERTRIAQRCHYCGAPIEVSYRQDRVLKYCTDCPGRDHPPTSVSDAPAEGYLGSLPLPPAGVHGRTAAEVYEAAWTWANLEFLSEASGVCSRCSAALDQSVTVCEDHAATDVCAACGNRHAVQFHADCPNCINDLHGPFVLKLVANTALLAFLTERGLDPVAPARASIAAVDRVHMAYEEEVRSTDPFEARFTFSAGDDTLSLTVDDDLQVVDVSR
ncbi:winged helix-turn-helix domain-containing protein [Salinigranum halophilum]|uniref:winged helix-turn-helix domain-containing protein n=1 Tax=Salinigranum halophilum TaxID=2565931 RepID=UPI0010A92D52|nr:winged helix-turn-helix domain-containing protein [Salinigranum halophilum]